MVVITREAKRKSERKKSILQPVSKDMDMEHQARDAMLGAAKKRKKTGRSMAGRESDPRNLWYSATNSTR